MAELIKGKVKRAKKAIIKCKELLDIAERKIDEAKSKEMLQYVLDDSKQKTAKFRKLKLFSINFLKNLISKYKEEMTE